MNSLLKKMLIFLLVMAVVAATAWFGRKAYKRATERRAVAEATQFLQKNDVKNSLLALRRALQVNPNSVPATAMMADLLDSGGVPAALSWRIRAVQLQPDNSSNRFTLAETALKLRDYRTVKEALDGVRANARGSADYLKLEGALAWSQGSNDVAERYYHEAQQLEPDNQSITMNLATIGMVSTNAQAAAAARAMMEKVAARPDVHVQALRLLLADATRRRAYASGVNYAAEILQNTNTAIPDRINYLQVLKLASNSSYSSYLAAEKEQAAKSPVEAFALGRWMVGGESPAAALRWLQSLPASIQTNDPVPLVMADCEIDLKDWPALLALADKQDWGDANCSRQALIALADRSLKDEPGAQSAWHKAVRLSEHRLDRLARLAEVTALWGWDAENTEVLNNIATQFPREKWASDQLAGKLYATGNTRELNNLLSKLYAADTGDARLKNNLANVCLLRKSDLDNAYRLAHEAYTSAPQNPFFTATYAYSLLLQKKDDEAVKVFSGLKPEYLKIPSVAAYYGVVEAEAGHKDLAKEPLERAASAKLLPEENEMVRSAMARL